MNTSIKSIVLCVICSITLSACLKSNQNLKNQNDNQSNPINYDDLDQKIKLVMSEKSIPGMSVLIVHDQDVSFQKSYGVTEVNGHNYMNNDSSVRLASATKVLTGLLVMSMAEDKVIELDMPFQTYFPDAPEAWYGIPLWRMLNHTSGMPKFLNSEEFEALSNVDKTTYSHRNAFKFLSEKPLDFEPGSNWRYQQSAYSMLAMMLIELTGKSWDELLLEYVFEPAAMSSTQYGDSLGVHPTSYVLEEDELIESEYYYPRSFSMGGGYNSTSNDLVNLFKALNANKIVSQDFLFNESTESERLYDLKSEFYAPATIVKQFGSALSLGHSGGGGLADIRYFPQQEIGIAVFTNYSGSGVAIELTEYISTSLFGKKVSR